MKIPVTLIIMDGYGLAPPSSGNAIANAKTPVLDGFLKSCPHTALSASGEDVGLPEGQIGNSEVGHTNIGSGRIVFQELSKINNKIKSGAFFENAALIDVMDKTRAAGTALHLMGLLSPGGVHSHTEHLYALLELAKRRGAENVYIHAFTDGRDTPPASAEAVIASCEAKCAALGVGKIATVTGRFYAMDRDNRWDRVETAYNALVFGEGARNGDPAAAVRDSCGAGVTDEFIKPVVCDENGLVKANDSVIFFNFRPDRARELTRAFVDPGFDGFKRKNGCFPLRYVCMTQYDARMPNVTVAYPPEELKRTFGETVSALGLRQLRTAETEKYAHVTFFFNGGAEDAFPGEDRRLIPSPAAFATYDLIPEMSADAVAAAAAERIGSGEYDVIILNFANCDMVGHTGVYSAAVRAAETVDRCVGVVTDATARMGGVAVITADHGNAEQMTADDGVTPMTAHTTNPVPFIMCGAEAQLRPGRLCDVAPTLLDLMGIEKPAEMTGESLIIK
ncbi:MAG: 2,3-bisphosphoglycerate-independent phosphoglycerate mutase [Oscillospiraceae bacterium]|jgi:2,3-bisphosphoglycerate-independent phosphoglycerate mutase|nr:2,3-bisphosphoglycerate-independent phosphoglycerate mutase [Oscillospiraceae bacterium]